MSSVSCTVLKQKLTCVKNGGFDDKNEHCRAKPGKGDRKGLVRGNHPPHVHDGDKRERHSKQTGWEIRWETYLPWKTDPDSKHPALLEHLIYESALVCTTSALAFFS